MIEVITDGMRPNVLALAAHGKVSHQDYSRVVIPAVEEKLKMHPKIRAFFHLGEDFIGYTAEALWDDAKVGIQHYNAFERIAVITNVGWVKQAMRLFVVFVPCPIRFFSNEDILAAAAWVNE